MTARESDADANLHCLHDRVFAKGRVESEDDHCRDFLVARETAFRRLIENRAIRVLIGPRSKSGLKAFRLQNWGRL